jgi:putative heme-binding domain-containing protein
VPSKGSPVPLRVAAVEALAEIQDRESLPMLRSRFTAEPEVELRRAIARALGALSDKEGLDVLIAAVREDRTPEPVRDAALEAVEAIGTEKAVKALCQLLLESQSLTMQAAPRTPLPAPRLPGLIAALGRFQDPAAVPPLIGSLRNSAPAVRAAAVDALAAIVGRRPDDPVHGQVAQVVRGLIADPAVAVQQRAIAAAGALRDRAAIPGLLAAAERSESRFEAGLALAALPDLHALPVYLRGLADKNPELRRASADAMAHLRDQAAPALDQLARRGELPPAIVPELRTIYANLKPILSWRLLGPFPIAAEPAVAAPGRPIDQAAVFEGVGGRRLTWRTVRAVDSQGRIDLGAISSHDVEVAAYGYAEIDSPADRSARLAAGSDDTLTVWLNGQQVYQFAERREFEPAQARFDVTLRKGTNRVWIRCGHCGGSWRFAVAASEPVDHAFLNAAAAQVFNPETYRAAALQGRGDAPRGRKLFHDLKGLACIKCHAVGKEGSTVGPELSSVASKYPRDELIAAVIDPSAKISSGYEPTILALTDGRVVTGIVRNETPEAVEIQDADARTLRIAKDQIDARKQGEVSIMPNGLAQGISPQDFADLIAYLETLKNADSPNR